MLCAGFLGVVLGGYALYNSACNLVDEFGISDILGRVVILSIATTIPEKSIAVLSSHKGQMDITLANTVGSNIFLLTLCIGIVWLAAGGSYDGVDNFFLNPQPSTQLNMAKSRDVSMQDFQGRWTRALG